MGQLENLRELSTAQLEYIYKRRRKRRRKYALVDLSNGKSSKF
jgi:hypothetical protein